MRYLGSVAARGGGGGSGAGAGGFSSTSSILVSMLAGSSAVAGSSVFTSWMLLAKSLASENSRPPSARTARAQR